MALGRRVPGRHPGVLVKLDDGQGRFAHHQRKPALDGAQLGLGLSFFGHVHDGAEVNVLPGVRVVNQAHVLRDPEGASVLAINLRLAADERAALAR